MRIVLMLILLWINVLYGAELPHVTVSVTPSRAVAAPGDTVVFALSITIPKDFHLYANPLGAGVGTPVTLTVNPSSSIAWIGARQERPFKDIPEGMEDLWTWQWRDHCTLYLSGIVREDAKTLSEKVVLDGLICKESCLPVHEVLTLAIPLGASSSQWDGAQSLKDGYASALLMPLDGEGNNGNVVTDPFFDGSPMALVPKESSQETGSGSINAADYGWTFTAVEKKTEFNILLALLFAFIAGVILNAMPCVLPVLGIKILAFSKASGGSRKNALLQSAAFTVGMLAVFLLLATLAAFAGFSWGDQFQNPVFIVVLVCLMFLFGLGMFDLFILLVPSGIARLDDLQKEKSDFLSNASKGAFATVLATPCSGPFLGATLAWTLTQPPLVIYAVFTALGLGMASPYILLASSQRLVRLIPKPGAWMEDFKHLLGFGLFGFAVYLMGGLPAGWIAPTAGMLVALSAAVIAFVRIAPFGASLRRVIVASGCVGLILWVGYILTFEKVVSIEKVKSEQHSRGATVWLEFTPARFDSTRAAGADIAIDFTANWCMNCQFNKINVYHSPEMENLIRRKQIVVLKADFTGPNPSAEALRTQLGSRSIPFFALFDARDYNRPQVWRDLVKKDALLQALQKLSGP